jgi:glucose/arabinose dehydrogenase
MKHFLCGVVAWSLVVGGAGEAKGDLLVASFDSGQVLRYDEDTGAFLGVFATTPLKPPGPTGLAIGPDSNLYVGVSQANEILRFYGQTGAFIDIFARGGGLNGPGNLAFGSDGNLYVASFGAADNSSVLRYSGTTGAFLSTFVPKGSGGLSGVEGLVFGPDDNLYVTSRVTNQVLRYDGSTGKFLGVFAKTLGDNGPIDLVFGPDRNLYILENPLLSNPRLLEVERFNGSTGAFMEVFANLTGSPGNLAFGPNGNLYVSTGFIGNSVIQLNGSTGQVINEFRGGGLDWSAGLVFVAPVPEPSTLLLLAIGTLGVIGWVWRRGGGASWHNALTTRRS